MTGTTAYLEICGGIASGKTTLAQLLEPSGFVGLFEDFRANPFWELFYEDPKLYSFETEVTFLLQHYNQIKTAIRDAATPVLDSSIVLDEAYADINLSGTQGDIFFELTRVVRDEIGLPKLLIHLECDPAEELRRIRARARPQENVITVDYLSNLNKALAARVKQNSAKTKVLTIDSAELNFADDKTTQKQVREMLVDALNS